METRTGGEAVEYAASLADCAYFLDHFAVIDDAQGHGEGSGTMPFRLWPAQVGVVWGLMTTPLTIILKARQLGISWLCCGYALWLCLFHPGKLVLLFSQGELEANEMLRRVGAMYDRLPAWMRDLNPYAKPPNAGELLWANGSRVRSLPATQRAGRSFTASLVIMDEAAHMQWAGSLYTALKPTIDGGGQLVVLSTANGIGNLFHLLWTKATAGLNSFSTVFLPWWSRPGRDQAWYAAKVAEETEPGKVKQEYPESAAEAFLVSGRVRFQSEWVTAQAARRHEPLSVNFLAPAFRNDPSLVVYGLPVVGREYIVAADVAEGLEGGDYSSAVVIDRESWEELADFHGHWEPDEFARGLAAIGLVYGADIVVERNNHGHAVLATLKALGYPKIAKGKDGRPGWLTNAKTKPQAIDSLAVALRDRLAVVKTAATLDEMLIYRVGPDGETGAPSGYHDDRVMKWAVGIGWIKLKPTSNFEIL